jgi:hypothetical protein
MDLFLRLIELSNVDNISEDDSTLKIQIRQEGKFKLRSQGYTLTDSTETITFDGADIFSKKISVPSKFFLELSKDTKVID